MMGASAWIYTCRCDCSVAALVGVVYIDQPVLINTYRSAHGLPMVNGGTLPGGVKHYCEIACSLIC